MAYGHRPMFPEYFPRNPTYRDLAILEGGSIYDHLGNRLTSIGSVDLIDWLCTHNYNLFAGSFLDMDILHILQEMAFDSRARIICTKEGRPILARIQAGKQTRWLVSARSWGNDESPNPEWIRSMDGLYRYYELGYFPTPSSLGVGLMRKVYAANGLRRHTAANNASERFLRQHAVGGIVQTPGRGKHYRSLALLDMASAWVSQYVLHPAGTAEAINGDTNTDCYFEYFVECEVFVPRTLPLGPFPIRTGAKNGQRVIYPTEAGFYKNVFLWRIQIDDCRQSGCVVAIKRGYGWRDYTTDNSFWAKSAYEKRQGANNGFIAQQSKAINVAAIGRMFRPRDGYVLKGFEGEIGQGGQRSCASPGGFVEEKRRNIQLVTSQREPVNLYAVPDVDNRSALMPHWYAYTITACNSHVYNFALPYAKEGRLVAIDYDSIMVLEDLEGRQFISKKSFEATHCPPGTWLYMQLHNVRILNHRSFESDEITKKPGVMR